MPTSYVLEPGLCWPGIDRSTWPPTYRLGVVTLRVFVSGLTDHIRKKEDDAAAAAELRHNERLKRIRREIEGER